MSLKRFVALTIAGFLVLCGAASCTGKKPAHSKPAELTTTEKARMADSMLNAGRVREALAILEEALQEMPDNPQLRKFYGYACFRAGRLDDAEKALLSALELDPYLTDARNFLGAVYDQQGRPSDAEREWKKALEDPSYPTPELLYLNLGVLYAGQSRDAEAIEMLRKSVEINPRFYQGHYELASILERTDQLEEAAREFEVAAPAYRNVGEYYYRLGLTYLRLKQNDKAREALGRALTVAPGSPSAAQAGDLLKMLE